MDVAINSGSQGSAVKLGLGIPEVRILFGEIFWERGRRGVDLDCQRLWLRL